MVTLTKKCIVASLIGGLICTSVVSLTLKNFPTLFLMMLVGITCTIFILSYAVFESTYKSEQQSDATESKASDIVLRLLLLTIFSIPTIGLLTGYLSVNVQKQPAHFMDYFDIFLIILIYACTIFVRLRRHLILAILIFVLSILLVNSEDKGNWFSGSLQFLQSSENLIPGILALQIMCSLQVVAMLVTTMTQDIVNFKKPNRTRALLTNGYLTLVLLIALFPPWSVYAEVPSGATTNDILAFLGHSFLLSRPPTYLFCESQLTPGISWFQIMVEIFSVTLMTYLASKLADTWIPLAKLKSNQWLVLAGSLLAILTAVTIPPWRFFEQERFVSTKYSDNYFGGFYLIWSHPRPKTDLGSPMKAEIDLITLAIELSFILSSGAAGLILLNRAERGKSPAEDSGSYNEQFEAKAVESCQEQLLKPLDLKAIKSWLNQLYKGKRRKLPPTKEWIIADTPVTANQLALALQNLSTTEDALPIRSHINPQDFPTDLARTLIKKALDATTRKMKLPAGQFVIEFANYEFEYGLNHDPDSSKGIGTAIKPIVSLEPGTNQIQIAELQNNLTEIVALTRKCYQYMIHTRVKVSPMNYMYSSPSDSQKEWVDIFNKQPLWNFCSIVSKAISSNENGQSNGYYSTTVDDAGRLLDHIGTFAWLYDDLAIIARPPITLVLDEKGYPHSPDQNKPAIEYATGWKIWAEHGEVTKQLGSAREDDTTT